MPIDKIARRSSQTPGRGNTSFANPIYVDSDTDELKFGAAATGTTEKVAADLTSTQSLANKTLPGAVLTTPTLGVATATSINKVTITAPATTATLTLVEGGSLVTAGAFVTTLTSTATTGVTLPTTGTLATLAGAETFTNKTLTAPVIATISNSGTVTLPTGASTLATIAGTEALTGKTLTANINADTKFATTEFVAVTGTTGTTLTAVVGMSQTVVVGTYLFQIYLPGVATANCGNKYGFKLTTAVLSALEATGASFTASGVAVQHTTTATDLAALFAATAANLYTIITGRMTVSTGGTVALFAAQNAAHADETKVYIGASMTFTRVA